MLQYDERPLNAEEQEFFRGLYQKHYTALCDYVYRLGFGREAAEDYVQDAFATAMRRIEDTRNAGNPGMYLKQILKNVVGYQLRSLRYAINLQKRLRDGVAQSQREQYEDELKIETLYKGTISDEELDLLTRFYLKGWSQKELAAEMAVSENAVQQRIKRAKQRLRSALEEDKPHGSEKPLAQSNIPEERRTEIC